MLWLLILSCVEGHLATGGPPTHKVAPPSADGPVLCINEFMARNVLSLGLAEGAEPDWLELFNPSAETVSLEGWTLSDDPEGADAHVLDAAPDLDPGAAQVLLADGGDGPTQLPFALDADGGSIVLTDPGGNAQAVHYGEQQADISQARRTDCCTGADCWTPMRHGTPGYPNDSDAAPVEELVALGSSWAYLDTGEDPGEDWVLGTFDDSTWLTGPGPLGLGDDHQVTVIDGGESSARHPTTWFRFIFPVTRAITLRDLHLSLMVDDSAVVWLNGVEVQRVNLTTTEEVTADTWALTAIAEPNEEAVIDYRLDVGMLVDGDNVLAVEVHQAAATSSDLTFDAGLRATRM